MLSVSYHTSSSLFERDKDLASLDQPENIINKLALSWSTYKSYLNNIGMSYFDKNKKLIQYWGPQTNWQNNHAVTLKLGTESGRGISYFSCDDICYLNSSSSLSPYTFDYGSLHLRIPVENIILELKKYTQFNITVFNSFDKSKQSHNNAYRQFNVTTSITHYSELQHVIKKNISHNDEIFIHSDAYDFSRSFLDKYQAEGIIFLFSQDVSNDFKQVDITFLQMLLGSLLILLLLIIVLNASIHKAIKRIQDLSTIFPSIGRGEFDKAEKNLAKQSLTVNKTPIDEVNFLYHSAQKLTHELRHLHNSINKRNTQLQQLANIDNLTQIYNRRRFNKSLNDYHIARKPFSLAIIDLDHFKLINDTLGHASGDRLLIMIATILKSSITNNGIVGRLGGDEFALIINTSSKKKIRKLIAGIIKKIDAIHLNSTTTFIVKPRISTGIACYPKHTKDLSQLTAFADAAMYENKQRKKDFCNFYTGNEIIINIEKRTSYWNNTISYALSNQFIVPYFQSIIDTKTRKTVAFEALARLNYYGKGVDKNSASEFIYYAEKSHAIIQIDKHMIDAVLKKASHLSPQPTLMINLSNITLATPHIDRFIQERIDYYRFSPNNIVIEITESSEVQDFKHTNTLINRLHSIGIRFALDDFGTGYSSFNYISNMRFDFVKIDKIFLAGLLDEKSSPANYFIIESIVNLAKKLNFKTVAEGIESQEYLDKLEAFDIDLLQGYLFAKPSAELNIACEGDCHAATD